MRCVPRTADRTRRVSQHVAPVDFPREVVELWRCGDVLDWLPHYQIFPVRHLEVGQHRACERFGDVCDLEHRVDGGLVGLAESELARLSAVDERDD